MRQKRPAVSRAGTGRRVPAVEPACEIPPGRLSALQAAGSEYRCERAIPEPLTWISLGVVRFQKWLGGSARLLCPIFVVE